MNYIYAAGQLLAIYEQKGSTNNMQYLYTDYLGSIRAVSNSSGTLLQVLSYDACLPVRSAAKAGGNRRDPQSGVIYTTPPTNLLFYRGYTGHEHLDGLGLINMNGRVYDPVLAIFLSPDNYVQDHTNSQNFNRYAYCWNNPFAYSDPSGESVIGIIFIVAFAYAGGVQANFNHGVETGGNPFNPGEWDWSSARTYFGIGTGALMGASVGGVILPKLFPNLPSIFPTQPSILLEGLEEAGRQVLINGAVNIIDGDEFFDSWGWAAGSGFITGAGKGYRLAKEIGLEGWEGFYASLDKRAQAWMDYYYGKDNVKVYHASRKRLKELNERQGATTKYQYDGHGNIESHRKDVNRIDYHIDGIYDPRARTVYLTRKTIRHVRLNGGWGKGTFFHEASHALFRFDNPCAYEYGDQNGGWRYTLRTRRQR